VNLDLANWSARFDYARDIERRGPLKPTADHLALLNAACWGWDDAEFGAAAIDAKSPYGNSSVELDLAVLLPHLSPEERLKRHCELPALLAYITAKAEDIQW
jgi:hypothetical protein